MGSVLGVTCLETEQEKNRVSAPGCVVSENRSQCQWVAVKGFGRGDELSIMSSSMSVETPAECLSKDWLKISATTGTGISRGEGVGEYWEW